MQLKILFRLCILAILLLPFACKKDETVTTTIGQPPPIPVMSVVACHKTTTWDSLSINNKLIGSWNWEYIYCFFSTEKGNYDDFKGLTVEFKSDNTLAVSVNGRTTQTASWKVKDLKDGFFKVETSQLVLQLPGRILFCNERVVFNDSYVDGCDNYFKKKI